MTKIVKFIKNASTITFTKITLKHHLCFGFKQQCFTLNLSNQAKWLTKNSNKQCTTAVKDWLIVIFQPMRVSQGIKLTNKRTNLGLSMDAAGECTVQWQSVVYLVTT